MQVNIHPSWKEALADEFDKPYFENLISFVKEEYKHHTCYPPGKQIFAAFDYCPFDKVKVVILGQDPYHNPGQAHGLSFSVPDGVKPPPSLMNIFKEIQDDLGLPYPSTGNLEKWARQGVLLLNASLTVVANTPMSHSQIGWHIFTDEVIKHISSAKENVVFMLWGKFAQNKAALIDANKHKILTAAHPSPLSAYNGFMGCRHFSKTNQYLQHVGEKPIDWALQRY